ncbi:hypothetical protein A1O3_05413 [Capronia epimyces CBS 606.96]|uniref:CRIB domain-containing protein n=1 Tax=Capronia epimyces CBS 606.96 TaxID=1182542 RepID=W9Y689_9EURO|nr:uncharacterized protein A1O3_05413 [Capronia epimyces CBS 606.96]EXJ84741.1 hypothetical protein A1O3_05413 [Capronia epimyces CBS 606.96]
MEVIGLVGTVLGVIDVATRCISSLVELRQRMKAASSTVEFLSSQLVTVRAALGQIHSLIEESLNQDEQHYQLTLDLGVAINCCNLLIRLLDEQISRIQYGDDDEPTFNSKVNLILESKGIEQCLTRLDRQINALNLLITTFQCRTPMEQHRVLHERQSRKVFDQIKDDSSSLIVLCDSASFVTRRTKTTTATSKFSMNFIFDAEILQAKAYKSTMRSLMRRARNQPGSASSTTPAGFHLDSASATAAKWPFAGRNVRISAPMNAHHMQHVVYDDDTGQYSGLPTEWQKLLAVSDVGEHDRQQLEEWIEKERRNSTSYEFPRPAPAPPF